MKNYYVDVASTTGFGSIELETIQENIRVSNAYDFDF